MFLINESSASNQAGTSKACFPGAERAWLPLYDVPAPDSAQQTVSLISKVLGNVLSDPNNAKFRRLRLSNAKIQEAIVDASGGLEYLQVGNAAGTASSHKPARGRSISIKSP